MVVVGDISPGLVATDESVWHTSLAQCLLQLGDENVTVSKDDAQLLIMVGTTSILSQGEALTCACWQHTEYRLIDLAECLVDMVDGTDLVRTEGDHRYNTSS